MPRTTAGSRRLDEVTVARRIAWELVQRRWSYQDLAARMAKAQCPIDQSAIHKITKKGRRITVNELVAFSEVFEVSINELFVPLAAALSRRQHELLQELEVHRHAYVSATQPMAETIMKIAVLMRQTGYFTPRLLNALAAQEASMVNLTDVALEAEWAIEGKDLAGEFPAETQADLQDHRPDKS